MATNWKLAPDIASRIRELREAMGWTQGDLAFEVNRAPQAISTWETGRVMPPKRVLERLVLKHGWPLEIFAEGGPSPQLARLHHLARPRPGQTLIEALREEDQKRSQAAHALNAQRADPNRPRHIALDPETLDRLKTVAAGGDIDERVEFEHRISLALGEWLTSETDASGRVPALSAFEVLYEMSMVAIIFAASPPTAIADALRRSRELLLTRRQALLRRLEESRQRGAKPPGAVASEGDSVAAAEDTEEVPAPSVAEDADAVARRAAITQDLAKLNPPARRAHRRRRAAGEE